MSELTQTISDRGNLVGTLVSISSPALAESLSATGIDWLFYDLEHSVMSLADVQAMIQAMRPGCLSMIRVEEPQSVFVKRALDTGCAAIIVPQVNSPQIARAIVQAGKFPPAGSRSVGLGRALSYGVTLGQGVKQENERTALIVQIEHRDAVAEVDEIANIDGVDALFVGPYDLSGSFGVPGQLDDARVQEAINTTLRAAKRARKPAGIFVGTAEAAKREFGRGFEFAAVGSDLGRLSMATKAMVDETRRR